jgi:hypothetical protein
VSSYFTFTWDFLKPLKSSGAFSPPKLLVIDTPGKLALPIKVNLVLGNS